MKYRKDKKGNDISVLGYGCMRFSKKGGRIDIDKAEAELMEAIKGGVNYFDTAYVYGGSEAALGSILEKNRCRDKISIATKLPHYLIKSKESMEKHFQEQLKRLRTDYIDYYLMHMLTDIATWEKLLTLGIDDWIKEKLKSGQIRNIGFSYHGSTDMFMQLIDVYPWDFCQIQYNYMDEFSQGGRRGLQRAHELGIPVVIMEPLRGGKLVHLLPEKAKEFFENYNQERTPAEWAFRWLWDQPEIMTVLSGMNSLEMVRENIRIASETEPGAMTEQDFALIEQVKEEINKNIKVNCTACGYCLPCPAGIDIPGVFRCYNVAHTEQMSTGRMEYIKCTALRKNQSGAALCINCGKCEKHCPQSIAIRNELKNAGKDLETPLYKIASKLVRWFRFW